MNDHVLKHACPGVVTGKLSDFAGLFFFPLFLADVLGHLTPPVALWPLFLADGLLLDPLRNLADERGWPLVEPLGAQAAPLVLARYAAARDGVA